MLPDIRGLAPTEISTCVVHLMWLARLVKGALYLKSVVHESLTLMTGIVGAIPMLPDIRGLASMEITICVVHLM